MAQVIPQTESEPLAEAPLPTVSEILDLPAMRAGHPQVLAAMDALSTEVRWVQVSERADDPAFLEGGELILTAGIGLPESGEELCDYVKALSKAGSSGLVIELGHRFAEAPARLVTICAKVRLPLIAVSAGISFIRVAETVHSLITQRQLAALKMSDQAHETFTRMCIEGATARDIVGELSRLCGCPAVLENLVHQVLAYEPSNVSVSQLLGRWESRSRDASAGGDLSGYGPDGWVSAWVEIKGRTWGRLVLLPSGTSTPTQVIALKRAATALALNRLLEQNQSTLERQAHGSTLADIIEHRFRAKPEMYAHTAALGVPTKNRALVAAIVDVLALPHPGTKEAAAETIASVVSAIGEPALVADLRRGRIGVLFSLHLNEDRRGALTRFVRDLRKRGPGWTDSALVVAVGSTVNDLDQVARSFTEAHQVADAARGANTEKLFYELPDIQLRGLLHVLGDDPRLQSFVERTLGALLDFDRRNDTDLVDSLRTFLLHGGNKSAAAEAAHVARQTFYRRLATVQRILSMDLESAEVRTSLHAAIMALESQRSVRRQDQLGMLENRNLLGRERANAESAW